MTDAVPLAELDAQLLVLRRLRDAAIDAGHDGEEDWIEARIDEVQAQREVLQ